MTLTVIASSSLSPGLRGVLTKWALELLPGAFVGNISARVRHQVWTEVVAWIDESGTGYASLVYASDEDQGFTIKQVGEHRYQACLLYTSPSPRD